MRSCQIWFIGFCLLVVPARAAEPADRVVQDIWNAAYLEGGKGGYVHTSIREALRDGKRFYRTVMTLSLTIKRNGATITIRMDTGSEETAQGKVTKVWMRQYQGDQEQLVLQGTVKDGRLEVKVAGKAE